VQNDFSEVTQNGPHKEHDDIAQHIDSLYNDPDKKGISWKNKALALSKSTNSYHFMSLRRTFGALNAVISFTQNPDLIKEQIKLIDNLIHTAEVSKDVPNNKYRFKDDFKGWVSKQNNVTKNIEVPLYESYSFFYITQFLYLVKKDGWVHKSQKNRHWWEKTLAFVEKNEWEKWYKRSYKIHHKHYRIFLRSRTHMGSHWAGIAMYLNALTNNPNIKKQTKSLVSQYDLLLKRNLRTVGDRYVWNSTYDNVKGTDAKKIQANHIQDVSHGNQVVSYIVAAYEFGNPDWTLDDIHKLCNTLKYIYNNSTNRFADLVNGSSSTSRPGWGNFVADGWIKLARYDDKVRAIFEKFEKTDICKKYNHGLEFKANLFKDEVTAKE
jgi:hypothetical protein